MFSENHPTQRKFGYKDLAGTGPWVNYFAPRKGRNDCLKMWCLIKPLIFWEKTKKIGSLPMTDVCFFNQQMADLLQHIAVIFEIVAVCLVWRDYKLRESDLAKKGRGTALMGMPIPHAKRTKGFIFGLVIGGLAILMEFYQLASQYLGC